MEPTIITKGIKAGEAIQQYLLERLESVLAHTQDSIKQITVRLSDANKIKRGLKTRCFIQFTLPGMPSIVVTEFASDVKSAIDNATKRAARVLNKTLDKAKSIPHTSMPLYFNKSFMTLYSCC